MTSVLLKFLLTVVLLYIFWVLFKPEKKRPGKKVARKKIVRKNKTADKKPAILLPNMQQIRRNTAEQMKKNPEIVSRVIRHWLREK